MSAPVAQQGLTFGTGGGLKFRDGPSTGLVFGTVITTIPTPGAPPPIPPPPGPGTPPPPGPPPVPTEPPGPTTPPGTTIPDPTVPDWEPPPGTIPTPQPNLPPSVSVGIMTLSNVGTAPTTPIYTLRGPLNYPTLTTYLGSMRYNAAIPAGQTVVIDPAGPSVLLGGVQSRRELLYPANFEAFVVPARSTTAAGVVLSGKLSVGLTHSGPVSDSGTATAVYQAAWF